MGFLDNLTWKEYFLIGGLLIIWALVAWASLDAFSTNNIVNVGFFGIIGIVATGALLILIAVIEKIF
ncbi:MAG: hypothetical protein ACFFE8_05845 [Candidatus Heimdallarchaeota archaeon]